MQYFLDFDGVIFNIDALKQKMAELSLTHESRTPALLEAIMTADPHFDLKRLVFPDALQFLTQNAQRCHVVSSYVSSSSQGNDVLLEKEYQKKKIALSGVTALLGERKVHVVGASKSEILSELQKECTAHSEQCVFVDDRQEHILAAQKLGITALLMIRSGETHAETPCIHSFEELA